MTKIDQILHEQMKDREFAAEYRAETRRTERAVSLYQARERAGYTKKQLAQSAHVSEMEITKMENGEDVDLTALTQVANQLGMNLKA
ncbi:helix-turn-helix transcriptional regulator [Lactobacillus sp. ESL0791]|uniref:helix-turn-helix domain-containing protein n=1 Tax=Lactobacillus sp. ESL0791 TaxID=2983234 RepID=UPI0023F9774C|nr:helix-turn-helix transcriptional regulator [Lactobacillus sp. ESL0791]MDF7638644.1 helix-turn-helix transcriptional regulator [Lactobacillus sp. ESL0791]